MKTSRRYIRIPLRALLPNLPLQSMLPSNNAPQLYGDYVDELIKMFNDIHTRVRNSISASVAQTKRQYDKHTFSRHFQPGQLVLIKIPVKPAAEAPGEKFYAHWRGPYQILFVFDDKTTYRILDPISNEQRSENINNMKSYRTTNTSTQPNNHRNVHFVCAVAHVPLPNKVIARTCGATLSGTRIAYAIKSRIFAYANIHDAYAYKRRIETRDASFAENFDLAAYGKFRTASAVQHFNLPAVSEGIFVTVRRRPSTLLHSMQSRSIPLPSQKMEEDEDNEPIYREPAFSATDLPEPERGNSDTERDDTTTKNKPSTKSQRQKTDAEKLAEVNEAIKYAEESWRREQQTIVSAGLSQLLLFDGRTAVE